MIHRMHELPAPVVGLVESIAEGFREFDSRGAEQWALEFEAGWFPWLEIARWERALLTGRAGGAVALRAAFDAALAAADDCGLESRARELHALISPRAPFELVRPVPNGEGGA